MADYFARPRNHWVATPMTPMATPMTGVATPMTVRTWSSKACPCEPIDVASSASCCVCVSFLINSATAIYSAGAILVARRGWSTRGAGTKRYGLFTHRSNSLLQSDSTCQHGAKKYSEVTVLVRVAVCFGLGVMASVVASAWSALVTCISSSSRGRPGERTAGGAGEEGAEGEKLEAPPPIIEEQEELEQQLQAASHPRSP